MNKAEEIRALMQASPDSGEYKGPINIHKLAARIADLEQQLANMREQLNNYIQENRGEIVELQRHSGLMPGVRRGPSAGGGR